MVPHDASHQREILDPPPSLSLHHVYGFLLTWIYFRNKGNNLIFTFSGKVLLETDDTKKYVLRNRHVLEGDC